MEESSSKPVDAKYTVSISPDGLTAWLTVAPPEGDAAAPDLAAAKAALGKAGVVVGVDEAAIAEAVGPALGGRVEVARGIAPKHGVNGWLEPLVAVNRQRHVVEEGAQQDLRDLGEVPSVAAGTALMRRHAPVEGVAGKGVTGKLLPAGVVKAVEFSVSLQGAEVDPADPDLLRATMAGQPVLKQNGVLVEPIVKFDAIDMASGNVDFVGTIEIRGDVHAGMRIKAGGDIVVGGNVESSELEAGGNIVIKGGVIGHAPPEHKEGEPIGTARLTAKGSINARYLENCVAFAEQAVEVADAIIQSEVTVIDRVLVGQAEKQGKSAGKGSVVGGVVRATALVAANVLGGPDGAKTRIFVGVNPLLQKAVDEGRQKLDRKLKEHGELSKVVKLLASRPDKREIFDKARTTLRKVNEEIAEAIAEDRVLRERMQIAAKAKIVVRNRAFGGVTAVVGRLSRFLAEDQGPGVFLVDDDQLIYGDIAAYGDEGKATAP